MRRKINNTSTNLRKIVTIVVCDLAALIMCLLVFALFYFVLSNRIVTEPIVIAHPTSTLAPTAPPETATAATEPPVLTWKERFADKFSTTGTIITDTSYISENIHITIDKISTTDETHKMPVTYFVSDIYLTDIEQYQSAFSNGEYRPGANGSIQLTIKKNSGLVGINGDYYGVRNDGLVIRNSVLYRDSLFGDIMVLYYDGTMVPYSYDDIDLDAIIAKSPFQAWSFGPVLVKNYQMVDPDALPGDISKLNPRAAIGYYEPGHYCFVVVDGRNDNYSVGVTLEELSKIFYDLGCESAYNLDGGRTAAMVFDGEYISVRAGGGRHASDVIYIAELIEGDAK